MRKISATYIIPGDGTILKNGILILEDDGTVSGLIDTGGELREQEGLEHYSGILVPGFVIACFSLEQAIANNNCLEKEKLHNNSIHNNIFEKNFMQDVDAAMTKIDFQMQHSGIVAIGDFCTTSATLKIKQESKIYYHTFVEAIVRNQSDAGKAFATATSVQEQFQEAGLPATVTLRRSDSGFGELLLENQRPSFLQDLIKLQSDFPDIKIPELIERACLNGAKALKIQNRFGSFTKGKKPGVNLITGADLKQLKLKAASKVKVLQ